MTAALIAERAPDATAPTVTPDQLELVKRTVANGATDAELKLYLFDCARQGVHPLDKLLHFTKRGGKYTPVTSIDLMRIRAAETGEYAGSDDAEFSPRPTGATPETSHPPSAAHVTVWRLVQGTRCPFAATARWAEYYPGDASGTMWRKMPHTMLAKCAEALALRKGFPRQLAGLYAKEEMDQAEAPAAPSGDVARSAVGRGAGDNGQSSHGQTHAPASGVGNPSGPNGEGSAINTATGEEIPAGYHLIDSYTFDRGWHEIVVLGLDLKGGAMKLSTKTAAGDSARQAFYDQKPVRLDWKPKGPRNPGEGYLNKVYPLPDPLSESALGWERGDGHNEVGVIDEEPPF